MLIITYMKEKSHGFVIHLGDGIGERLRELTSGTRFCGSEPQHQHSPSYVTLG